MSKITRAERTDRNLAHSIIQTVQLMYQNNTAKNFYKGLLSVLEKEINKYGKNKKQKTN